MPSLVPKTRAVVEMMPQLAVEPAEIFAEPRYAATVSRVIKFLHRVYLTHSDASFERISRPGVVTEQFFVAMPTVDAYKAEVDLLNAIRDHALGTITDENIKIYLQKYLESHCFVYRETDRGWLQEFKTGYSRRTSWREVPLFEVSYADGRGLIANAIACEIYTRLEEKSGTNVKYSISRL
jgi:hypothetical protein